jgi:hypothetical protein
MFRMKRTHPSALALLLTLVLLLGALPAAAAGSGPSAGLAVNWEDLWSRFTAWASTTFGENSPYIDPLGGTGTDNSPYIDPNGQPESTGTGGAETETSPGVDPLGGH